MTEPAHVFAMGVACPLGLTARAAFAAVAAGLRRFVEVDDVVDAAGEPARGCRLQSLTDHEPLERALWFARRAIAEAAGPLGATAEMPVPVYVGVPASARAAGHRQRIVTALARATTSSVTLQWTDQSLVAEGRASGAIALTTAIEALRSAPLVLVGGLDCLVTGDALRELSRHNRLLGRRNCDGRLPGEAAAFLLLGRPGSLPRNSALGRVQAVACSHEPLPFTAESASEAAGLTRVLSTLRGQWPERVDEVVAAQSNERFFATELATAYLRNVELMPEPLRVRSLADVLGDCGASAFPLGLAWALSAFDPRPQWRDPLASALVVSSSDTGAVGGALITAAARPRSPLDAALTARGA